VTAVHYSTIVIQYTSVIVCFPRNKIYQPLLICRSIAKDLSIAEDLIKIYLKSLLLIP
jgi:hypothetical protein